jgi:hypothetical protein
MAAIGATVSLAAALAPRQFLTIFGVAEHDNGAARLAWRLFAARMATMSVVAARGNATAQEMFLPVQLMDQAAWWWGYKHREVPLRTAGLATVASALIIALDLRRRSSAGGRSVRAPSGSRG